MIEALLQTLFGPLGGILAAVGAVIGALALGRWQGKSGAVAKRDADDMKDAYNRERTRNEIDRSTSGPNARDRLRKDWGRD